MPATTESRLHGVAGYPAQVDGWLIRGRGCRLAEVSRANAIARCDEVW
jgi:hypothetical protein